MRFWEWLISLFTKKSDKPVDGNANNVLGSNPVSNPVVHEGSAVSEEVKNEIPKEPVGTLPADNSNVPVAGPNPVPVVSKEVAYEYHPVTGLPTRDQMLRVAIAMIEGKIPVKAGAYKLIRETEGKNRSVAIDGLIQRQGGKLGEAYCQYGQQEFLDELCAYYGIDRKKVKLPEGGGTQSIFNKIDQKYRRQAYEAMCWITWQQLLDPNKGHVGLTLEKMKGNFFRTFEFNTTAYGDDVVRDGQGAEYVKRTDGPTASMKVRGFTDVYQAIVDAMDPVIKMGPLA